MCSHEATNFCSMGFKTRQKLHFQAARMKRMRSHEAKKYTRTWVSRLSSKCIFRAPKCTKRANACVVRVWLWPLTFDPGREFGLFAWHLNFDLELKLTFSDRHKGENVFKRSYVRLKHGFHDSAKIATSSRQMQKMSSHERLNVSFKTRQ